MPPQIIDRAAEWLVAMRDPSVAPEQRAALADWLRASPTHVQAYLEMVKLWGDSAQVDPAFDVAVASSGNVVPLTDGAGPRQPIVRSRRPSRGGYAAAAAIVVAMAMGGGAWWQWSQAPAFAAGAGEQRTLTLDDGSVVRLNSRSSLRVRMSAGLRLIELREGQALFEVAPDPTRPFVVYSGSAAVRAVGTRFDVYRKPTGTLVSVVEGRVAVERADGASPQAIGPVLLGAGEQVTVSADGGIDRPEKPNVAAATSWLQQKLVFDGQPLGEVLQEFNRYARVPIVLTDPSLATLRVNAVFHTTSAESLLRFIERFDRIAIEHGDSEIRIVRRP
jgi:transmembrane sensor